MKRIFPFLPKGISILTAIFFAALLTTNATVWRVNNRPNVDADFTTLAAAYTGASAGDTIYLEGSPFNYGGANFTKPLTVIGAGYWLNENDSTQAYKESSKIGTLYFYNGSQGSVIEGLQISVAGNYGGDGIWIAANEITIRRNHILVQGYIGGYYAAGIRINNYISSVTIEQNWIETHPGSEGFGYGIYFGDYTSNSLIRNNIIYCDTNDYAIRIVQVNEATSLIISNNVIMGRLNTSYSSHYNNILMWGDYTPGVDDINSNNLCNATQYPNLNSNQQNIVMTTVFEDYTTYIDSGYLLATGSPAIGAGVGGEDCGPSEQMILMSYQECLPYLPYLR